MARRLYILDFDRTIFDTLLFYTDIASVMQAKHDLDLDLFKQTYEQFFDAESGGYDIHAHHTNFVGITADEFDDVITNNLAGRDYRFADAAVWMDRRDPSDDLIIITMGIPRYQKLKFAHCSGLDGLTKVIVPSNKGALLRRHLEGEDTSHNLSFLDKPDRQLLLIDDSAETFTAPGDGLK